MPLAFAIKPGDPPVKHDPLGYCVYCGSTRYAKNSRRNLAEEHIIPEGLGGTLSIPLASCGDCERAINTFEQAILKSTFYVPRVRLGVRRKRRKRSHERYVLHGTLKGGKPVVANVPIQFAPPILFVPCFGPARFLLDGAPPHKEGGWILTLSGKWNDFQKLGLRSAFSPVLDVLGFSKFLAKIAHCYATSVLRDQLSPFLVPFIMEGTDKDRRQYVGGQREVEPASDNLHEFSINFAEVGGRKIAVVRIRLLANVGAPTYFVAAGAVKAI